MTWLIKDKIMKKKLLVLLIAAIPTLMPNLASAIAIDVGEKFYGLVLEDEKFIMITDFDF